MRERLDAWLVALLLLLGAGCIAFLSTRYGFVADCSANARASLAPQSQAVLAQLAGPVEVTSYATPGSGLRPTIAAFVARYRRFKPDLALRFVDPEQDPAAMRAAGISVDGELAIAWHGRKERLVTLNERDFTNALQRLARGGERLVAFVTGDGERRPDGQANADLGTFIAQIEARGMRAVPVNLDAAAGVPQNAALVVLASPQAALAPRAVAALTDYLARGGNLLWLAEPGGDDLGLAPLAAALGVRVLPGTLVDASGAAAKVPDPSFVVVTQYPPHVITRGFDLSTLFPQAAALATLQGSAAWAAAPLLRTSAQSWNETGPVAPGAGGAPIRQDADRGELRGPLDFGLALSRLSPSPDKGEQRAVVIGDGDFLSNSFLGNGGNRALGERVFDWLLGDDALVDLPARGAPDRSLALGQRGLTALTFGFLFALPLLLLGTGGAIAWRRRRR
ncbi:MAG: DUF4350 domain-containing protein [Mizugakiibacter sp.]|uniref:GldG family protein n=1 Tax=Mizugakiibacter sp. TaxID=1972610 RepID=UPI0031C08F8F|nr:GldG family protein [Xanthomonadaceae bacterium]